MGIAEQLTDEVIHAALKARALARDAVMENLAVVDVEAMSEVRRQGYAAMRAVLVSALAPLVEVEKPEAWDGWDHDDVCPCKECNTRESDAPVPVVSALAALPGEPERLHKPTLERAIEVVRQAGEKALEDYPIPEVISALEHLRDDAEATCPHEWEVKPGRFVWTCRNCGIYRMDAETRTGESQ